VRLGGMHFSHEGSENEATSHKSPAADGKFSDGTV
jgi:hypothetical protein